MCDPVQELDNAFGTVSGWVSSTLSGLSSTIESVLKNPLPTIATIGLTAIGVPAPIANAMVTAATGGSMEDMVISLATSYAGGQIGAAVGDLAVPELGGIAGYGGAGDLAFQPAASEAILKTVISNASAQGAAALLQGKDLDQVLNTALTGAVGGLINTSLRTQFGLDPSNFGDRLIGDATKAAVSSIFNGKDPGEAIGLALTNSAFGALANTAASGLKSTVKDLNDSTAEFETIKTQADGLREEIDSESTRLAGLSKELNSTSTALNSTQANIVASKDLLDIASNAYNGYFVVSDPAAQEAFAKRMGFDVVQTYGEGAQWAKNVQYATNGYYDPEGYRHYRQAIYTPDGEIDYNARVAISGDFINIGTEAKAVAEQQAAYLNNTVPKFKEDVEKFNTQLATFNTDNANLNTKVNTYTGLVTDLFGEDGEGGLNKKIEDLLIARDGYIEDLNESVASLTEAAGEQISGAAEDIVDDAVDLLDQNYRTSDEVSEAFASNPVFRGYKPTAAEEALFVGEGKDADLQGLIDTYVDEHSIDTDELIKLAGLEGYTLSDEDKASLVQQGDEDAISSRLRSEFDAKAVTPDEARQALTIGGYKPTNADIAAFTGNRSEAALNRDAAIYVDPRYLDYDEARDIARQEGYGELSAAETLRLAKNGQAGQIDEQQGVQALRNFYDAQAVTRQEAYDAFRSLGYEPSEAELNRFMGKGNETSRLSSLQTEFDPLVTTEDEVRQMYRDLGLPEPTADEIAGYIGKQAETDIYGKLEDVRDERNARLAKEAEDAEVAKKEAAAIEKGFPSYAVQQEFKDNVKAYKDSEAVKAGFPDDDTRTLYAGNVEKFIADENDKAALQSGFPDYATLQKYGGDINAYQDYQAEQTRIANESAAQSEGFPDYATQQKYQGDVKSYNAQLEADRIETQRVANEALAQKEGFPNYSTYSQFGGDLNAYTAAQNELMAKGAEFPDYKTYMEYGGDLNAYEQDLLERDAILAGFPDHATQVQYGGSYEAYQAELQEQARLEEERIAEAARAEQEEADRVAREQAEAARAAEAKADADRLAEAARVAEQEARLAEETRLAKEAEDARIAQETVNEELAQSNGFPDYATYLEFNGDQDAYLASLSPPSVEPEETLPVDEAPYVPVDDTEPPVEEPPYIPEDVAEPPLVVQEEAEPPISPEVPYTPGEDAEEFLPPYTPGEDAEEVQPGEEVVPPEPAPYTPGEDAEDFTEQPYSVTDDEGNTLTVYPDGTYTLTPAPDVAYDPLGGDMPPVVINNPENDPFGGDTPVVLDPANDPFGGDTPPVVISNPENDPFGGDTPVVTDPANDPLGGDMPEEEEEEIDPATGLPRIKIPQPAVPPKQTVPPKKPITPIPPGLTPEQLMQFFGQLGAPGIMGALQPYEMPYYFQIPEEQQFDITQAFSPTLYRLQKE